MTASGFPSRTLKTIMPGIAFPAAVYLIFSAMAPANEGAPGVSTVVVEWAPFELRAGADEHDLLRASEALQTQFLDHQTGFIRRELLKGAGNQWVDLVYWESRVDADQAAQNAASSPVCHTYFHLMVAADPDDPAAGVLHFEHKKVYPAAQQDSQREI